VRHLHAGRGACWGAERRGCDFSSATPGAAAVLATATRHEDQCQTAGVGHPGTASPQQQLALKGRAPAAAAAQRAVS
jgi:hypothetical protein